MLLLGACVFQRCQRVQFGHFSFRPLSGAGGEDRVCFEGCSIISSPFLNSATLGRYLFLNQLLLHINIRFFFFSSSRPQMVVPILAVLLLYIFESYSY